MENNLFGSHTDYTHLAFDDLPIYLDDKISTLEYYLNFIESDKKELDKSGYWSSKVIFNFILQANECIILYNSTIKELKDIKNEINIEVKQNHYNRLIRIASESHEINKRLGIIWHKEYDTKEYGNIEFAKVERIYGFSRDVSVTLTSLGNFAERLKDFIGRVTPVKKTKWERSHKIAIISLIISFIVLIFGNNLLEKLNLNSISLLPNYEKQNIEHFKEDTIINIKELPYLENYPIIDKGLFIKYNYNEFHIGGVNIDEISLNARTKLSNPLDITKEKDFISVRIIEEPFIEFKYKNKYYSMEISGEHYQFSFLLKQIKEPTMKLRISKGMK